MNDERLADCLEPVAVGDGIFGSPGKAGLQRWVEGGVHRLANNETVWVWMAAVFLLSGNLLDRAPVYSAEVGSSDARTVLRQTEAQLTEPMVTYHVLEFGETVTEAAKGVDNTAGGGVMVFRYDEGTQKATLFDPDTVMAGETIVFYTGFDEAMLARPPMNGLVTALSVTQESTSLEIATSLGFAGDQAQMAARMMDWANASRLDRSYGADYSTFFPGEMVFAPSPGMAEAATAPVDEAGSSDISASSESGVALWMCCIPAGLLVLFWVISRLQAHRPRVK